MFGLTTKTENKLIKLLAEVSGIDREKFAGWFSSIDEREVRRIAKNEREDGK